MHKFALICLIVLLAALSPAFAQDGPTIKEIIIAGEGIKNPGQIVRILPFKEGEQLDFMMIAKGVNILVKTGLFDPDKIEWETEDVTGGVRIVIHLTPLKFIRRIKFKNSFPLFRNELARSIHSREGDAYDEALVEKDEERLKRFLENEGYFDSEVEARAVEDRKTGDVRLVYKLKKGLTYNLLDVRAHGNVEVSDFRIRSVMRRHMLIRYRKEALDKGIEDILNLYRRKGYFEVRIKVVDVKWDRILRTAAVYLDIKEGPRAKVVFEGDRGATKRRLRKQLTLIEEESADEFDVETSALKIRDYYRKKGYRNANVTYNIITKNTPKGEVREITFLIEPGSKIVVTKVAFKGREEFHSGKLSKQILTGRRPRFWKPPVLSDAVLAEDVLALRAFYESWGFREANVSTPELEFSKDGKKVKVTIPIVEGKQTLVGDVTFSNMNFFEAEQALAELKLIPGAPFDPALLEADKKKLLFLYVNGGFPYAAVAQEYKIIEGPEGSVAMIGYDVKENERVHMGGEILIRGNYRTRARVLVREVELNAGEPFSYEELTKSRRNLRSLGFLDSVRLDTLGLEENLDTVHLIMAVSERRTRMYAFSVGYDSEIGLEGTASAGDLNLFGYGKAGKLTLMGGAELAKAELTYTDPRFLGIRVHTEMSASGQYQNRPAFDLTQAAGKLTVKRRFTPKTSLALVLRAEWNVLENVVDEAQVKDLDVSENNLVGFGPQFTIDTRDDFIDPSKGWFALMKIEYAREFISDHQWMKYSIQATTYLSAEDNFVFVLSATVGHIEPFGASLVPVQEAFYVGGNRSVRGYSEDGLGPRTTDGEPTGGFEMVVTNMEMRFPIVSVIHGVVFVDSGQLVGTLADLSAEAQLFTVGAGLRVKTPVGPIRIDWGYKLDPSPYEGRYKWHFSFGYPF